MHTYLYLTVHYGLYYRCTVACARRSSTKKHIVWGNMWLTLSQMHGCAEDAILM